MTNAIYYLEAAKADQVAAELAAEGYKVVREPENADAGYDLLATKDGKTIAIEIKARSQLQQASDQIRRLREQALKRGYSEFRLIVANPPREKIIEITGLEEALTRHLAEDVPQALYDVAAQPYIYGLSDLEINAINVSENGIHVTGTGMLDVALEWDGDKEHDGVSLNTDFPLSFDVTLNNDLQITEVHQFNVDTSSFEE
ncbi:MAG: restriction endonuclease [Chloroflexi bacterium]|nr:restriction endonuclease [Chloroflexota bacterium]